MGAIGELFTTWWFILGIVALLGLGGLLFYMRSQREED
jgi:LPXTG-motif cell wall-anchored protein